MTQTLGFEELCDAAKRLVSAGDYQAARSKYEQALQIHPDSSAVHQGLGTVCFLIGELDRAIEHFRQVNRVDPLRGSAFVNLGAVYNRAGRHKEAVDVLRRGIQLDPTRAEGYYNLGIAYRKLGDHELAVQAYREATRLNPRMADAHLNLANIYGETGRFSQAVNQYKAALAVRPNFDRALRGLKKAEQALAGSKTAAPDPARSPVAPAPVRPSAPAAPRPVTEQERLAARAALHNLAAEAEELIGRLLGCVRDDLEPAIKELELSVLQPTVLKQDQRTLFRRFERAVLRYEEFRRRLAKQMGQIRRENERF
ncbi:MAG: tetratricopeptide repeat protein [Pirellulales bacterium]